MADYYEFDCGCRIPIDPDSPPVHGRPSLIYRVEEMPLDCPKTWDLICSGRTRGLWQLESNLGRHWSKKIAPRNIEHLSALVALLRPGCIAGDVNVCVRFQTNRPSRKIHLKKMKIRDLYEKFSRKHPLSRSDIISLDEDTNLLRENIIDNIVFSGNKEVYRVVTRPVGRQQDDPRYYDLICTSDHLVMTHDRGWVQVKDILPNERIAVLRLRRSNRPRRNGGVLGERSFHDICRMHYVYRCVFCDWQEGSLDVNHLEGNRRVNNHHDNLCYLCPNHHRLYSEGKITKEMVIKNRERYRIKNTEHIEWRDIIRLESCGIQDTYDIGVRGPHHNFIAGNVVVHNCLKAKDERGVSMTELYKRRKNGEELVQIDIEAVRDILVSTFDIIVFQEQFMRIAQVVAGFDLLEVDKLRKASAKKLQEEMTKVGELFVEKADKLGVITREQAERLFANIRKTAKYSFNASHSVSYAHDCYWTAHEKAHFPVEFFTAYLAFAKDKPKPLDEIRSLVNEAKLFDIEVKPPRFSDLEEHFSTDGVEITFGLADVKGVGDRKVRKMAEAIPGVEAEIGKPRNVWSWFDFLVYFSGSVDAVLVKRMIEVGALRDFRLDRVRLLAEFDAWRRLTDSERAAVAGLRDPVVVEFSVGSAFDAFTASHPEARVCGAYDDEGKVGVVIDEARPCDNLIDALGHVLGRNLGYTKGTRKNPGHPKPAVSGRRRDAVRSLREMLINPPAPLVDKPYWIAKKEEEALGVPLTCSHVDAADKSLVNATCKDFRDGVADRVVLGVEVQEAKEVLTKVKREPMAFLTVSDGTGSLDNIVIFPEAWKKYGHLLVREKTIVAIRGNRDPTKGGLIVEEVWGI